MKHALIVACWSSPAALPCRLRLLGRRFGPSTRYAARDGCPLQDIHAYPEVIATDSFEQLRAIAQNKVAIWIDVNAVDLVDRAWLSEKPQSRYPIVLVGNGNELCSFRETLVYFTFEDVPGYPCDPPPPGFSLSIQTTESGGWWHGYEETPTVTEILRITNGLLEGRRPDGSPVP